MDLLYNQISRESLDSASIPQPYFCGPPGLEDATSDLAVRAHQPSAANSHSILRPPRHIQEKIHIYQQKRLSQHQKGSLTQKAIYWAPVRPGQGDGYQLQAHEQAARLGAKQRTQ